MPANTMSTDIPFSKVDCSGNEAAYVTEVLQSGWLTTASKAAGLEQEFCNFLGCKYAFAVNSCTSALHLALDALGVQRGDKVFVPSLTFTASAEVIRYMGADPVLLDVDPQTSGITSDIVARAISQHPDAKVLIAVHFGGLALPMSGDQGILEVCRNAGVKIVEDAAHALPSTDNGIPVGTLGDITCFSFYANKTMTTGEGGLLATQDENIAMRVKQMRLHGIDRDIWRRFTGDASSWEYDVVAPGFKYNMPDINAAVGLAQLERLGEMHRGRIRCATRYFELLSDLTHVIQLPYKPEVIEDHSWHLFPIRLRPGCAISRNDLIENLKDVGVGTSVHYKPIHRLQYYREMYDFRSSEFPVAEEIWQTTLSLPIYHLLEDDQIEYICESLHEIVSLKIAA